MNFIEAQPIFLYGVQFAPGFLVGIASNLISAFAFHLRRNFVGQVAGMGSLAER
jgi:hypothetical protein